MLDFNKVEQIKKAKNSNQHTRDLPLCDYIKDVKRRIAIWEGRNIDSITLDDVLHHIK